MIVCLFDLLSFPLMNVVILVNYVISSRLPLDYLSPNE